MSILNQPISQIFIRPLRKIGEIDVNVVISENTSDTLTITKQPVQQGASITDHAFKEPTIMQMVAYFNDNAGLNLTNIGAANPQDPLGIIYQKLLDLQQSRIPFDVITPKRVYRNVLMATIAQTTDKNTENTLSVSFTFQEVIIVQVGAVTVPRQKQKSAANTGATVNAGKKNVSIIQKAYNLSTGKIQ